METKIRESQDKEHKQKQELFGVVERLEERIRERDKRIRSLERHIDHYLSIFEKTIKASRTFSGVGKDDGA
mgnify:CR=1 FL=1